MLEGMMLLVLLLGVLILVVVFAERPMRRLHLPPLLVSLMLGIGLNVLDQRWQFIDTTTRNSLHLLAVASAGVLLFQVGLHSDVSKLRRYWKRARLIWFGDVIISGGLGFLCMYWVFGFGVVPSLFTAVALSATSLDASAAAWRDVHTLESKSRALMIDVAKLDTLSAIIFMTLLLTAAPIVAHIADGAQYSVGSILGLSILKLVTLAVLCYLFAAYLMRPILLWFKEIDTSDIAPILATMGIAIIITAVAGSLGIPLLVGALLAGLVHSRDHEEFNIEHYLTPIFQLASLLFFVGIGLSIDISSFGGLNLPMMLLAVAIVGKLVGVGLPVFATSGPHTAALLGISMMPRAEIAMIVAQQGMNLGSWAVSPKLFGALVFVVLATCLLGPVSTRLWLRWFPPSEDHGTTVPARKHKIRSDLVRMEQ